MCLILLLDCTISSCTYLHLLFLFVYSGRVVTRNRYFMSFMNYLKSALTLYSSSIQFVITPGAGNSKLIELDLFFFVNSGWLATNFHLLHDKN